MPMPYLVGGWVCGCVESVDESAWECGCAWVGVGAVVVLCTLVAELIPCPCFVWCGGRCKGRWVGGMSGMVVLILVVLIF